jgi:hypothetical protein
VAPPPATGAPPAPPPFTQEQLDQLLAPIALYPDALLAQVLMAATYPLEVIEADRWVKANPGVTGDALSNALQSQTWDASVKSLAAFPQVLAMMSDKLDWMQQTGDAFLAQQAQVMDTVQNLREKAQAAGNLQSNAQQNVTMQDRTIIIEPAQPQIVYVPTYNPTIVYGSWWYPSYPPYYFPPPPGAAFVSGFFWGVGIAAGAAMWGGWNWNNHSVNINVNNYNRYNHTTINNSNWQHNPANRGAVPYRDQASRDKYQNSNRQAVDSRRDYRGQTPGNNQANRPSTADRPGAANRPATTDRPGQGSASNRANMNQPSSRESRPTQQRQPGAFDMGSGSAARNDSTRGQASRQQMQSRPSNAGSTNRGGGGGAARSGGGGGAARGGGGGGRGR